jgi:multidrug transporter EmrE-like cation transporter
MSGGAAIGWITWVLILSGVSLNAAAQLLLKHATKALAGVERFDVGTVSASVLVLAKSGAFWLGMVCYGASLCIWLVALTKAPVSVAYPMLSIGYVLVAWASVIWLGEVMSPAKILGIALICVGVVLVSRSSV